jgi:hypothetical protein
MRHGAPTPASARKRLLNRPTVSLGLAAGRTVPAQNPESCRPVRLEFAIYQQISEVLRSLARGIVVLGRHPLALPPEAPQVALRPRLVRLQPLQPVVVRTQAIVLLIKVQITR